MQTTSVQSSTLAQRPTVMDLHESGRYRLVESFPIDSMVHFVRRELNMPTPQSKKVSPFSAKGFLKMLTIGMVSGLLGYIIVQKITGQSNSNLDWLGQIGWGFLAFFMILPTHEFIHGLMYRWVGAPTVGYGYSLKNLMVYAYSQAFTTTLREVALVAVMPFVVITVGLCIGWGLLPQYGAFWLTLLLTHAMGCLGDLALIVYWWKNRSRQMYTYDDVTGKRMTYFFEAM